MKRIAFILASLVLAVAVKPAAAQTATAQMGQIAFSEVERRLIEEFFGHSATTAPGADTPPPQGSTIDPATGQIIKDVIDVVTGNKTADDGDEDAQRDDDDGKDRKKGKKGKKGKGKKKGLPPGLAKRDSLPPGLQRQLERNGRLPPGLQARDLPDDLQAKMPPPQDGTERIVAGNDVVLVEQATGVILDILRDVATGRGQ